MAFNWGSRSLKRMRGVHPDLIRVMNRALSMSSVDMTVLYLGGRRTRAQQRELVRKGASKTMRSRHLTGHAIDVAPLIGGKPSWAWPAYYPLAETIKEAARLEGVPIEWGGDWKSFKDGPHWQLPRRHPYIDPVPY